MHKILFYLPFIKVGGLEKVSLVYMKKLIERGYQVDLLIDFDMGKEANTFEPLIPNGISYQYIKSKGVSQFLYSFRTFGKKHRLFNIFLYAFQILFDFYYYHSKVKGIVKRGQYDTSIVFYQFLPSYMTEFKNMTHIIWLHGSIEHFFDGVKRFFKESYGRKLDKYDYVVTIADEMREQLEKSYPYLPKEKLKLIYNPFDVEKIMKKSNDKTDTTMQEKVLLSDPYICTVTRIDEEQKDLKTLILAYEKLYKKNRIKEKLYIIGDGPSRKNLERFVKRKKLDKKILFLGKKTNPYLWMKHASLFVLSSKFEGFPTVLIEAMTVGTFIISSNCKTGPKEILDGGECGELFEVGNIDELVYKIEFALSYDNYKHEKIQKAYKHLEVFASDFSQIDVLNYDISKQCQGVVSISPDTERLL